ncbi:multiheme c-type cytochrome [Leptospira wolffii]|uniref:Multiheme c-type cytochrome n=1 Tax=Leptospira wolffii TaxID=409998 RepID=A0ABV5BI16_9LEPT
MRPTLVGCSISLLFFGVFLSLIYSSPRPEVGSLQKNLGFNQGLAPIAFDPEKDSIRNPRTGKLLKTAKDCGTCHKTVYQNWSASRHKEAHTNQIYRHSFSLEPMQWCENCHVPLRNGKELYLNTEGISCNVCHVRNGKIIVSRTPEVSHNILFHEYSQVKDFGSAKLCESCHQFNFPNAESLMKPEKGVVYSDLNMQGTFEEWSSSGISQESDCIDCHVAPDSGRSHSFQGGHSLSSLRKSLDVQAEYLGSKTIAIRVVSQGIGHSFPTGDLFRTLRLKVFSDSGKFREEFVLRKLYRNKHPNERNISDAPKVLESDTRIPPPIGNERNSWKEFYLKVDDRPQNIKIELWIDYLNDVEKIFSPLKPSDSKHRILKSRIRIEGRDRFKEGDMG